MGQAASSARTEPLQVVFCNSNAVPFAFEYTKRCLENDSNIVLKESDELNLLELVNTADVIVPLMTEVNKGLIARAPMLKMIMQFGHDVSSIDLETAVSNDILISRINSADAGIAESYTEYALYIAFSLMRQAYLTPENTARTLGENLCGMKALVFGIGGIAKCLVQRLVAIGCNAKSTDFVSAQYSDIIDQMDIIFFCCQVNNINKSFVNKEFLKKLKNRVYLVNVSKVFFFFHFVIFLF